MIEFIQKKPYFIFIALIVIFLTVGFFNPKKDLDINIHDTYFVISYLYFAVLLSVIYTFLAIIYFVVLKLKFTLISWMTVLHVLVSVGGLVLIWIFSQFIRKTASGNFESMLSDIYFNNKMTLGIVISIFSIVAMQVVFVVNVVQAFVKGRS